ncbi:MAG: pitrilysin family protein [Pyrinomonadaceae bacterium]
MTRWLVLVFAISAFLTAGSASAQVKVTPLDFHERTLANGLKVLSIVDHASPTVSVQVWYKVGSKDDPEGRSGFAHLFEHMMFKSTKNMPAEKFDRLTEDVGGYNNASTYDDYTNYYELVPSNYLETLLWAEAERMANLTVDDAVFKSERDVVKEEFRFRILSQPYGRLFYLIDKLSFTTHPYKRPGIGSIEELDAASVTDVRSFFRTFYRPDNATLIVSGDLDQKQFDAWVDKYFGRIAKPTAAIPRVTVTEPDRTESKRFTEYSPIAPLPAVAITYLAPPASSDDATALDLAETILSGGESSRLYKSLVYDQQLAQNAFSNSDTREDRGSFLLAAILANDKKPVDAEFALLAELRKMQDAPVTDAELSKAKNQLVTSTLQGRETNDGKASALAYAAVMLRDPARVNTDIARLQAVTAADIQRVMKKYFTEDNRVVIYYLPESMRANAGGKGQ